MRARFEPRRLPRDLRHVVFAAIIKYLANSGKGRGGGWRQCPACTGGEAGGQADGGDIGGIGCDERVVEEF
jgi:hypothetical protein